MSQEDTSEQEFIQKKGECVQKILEWCKQLQGVVLGPGLGRDQFIENYFCDIL